MKVKELSGKRFGRLIVIKRGRGKTNTNAYWECLCDCGKKSIVRSPELTKGHTKSCGCLSKELVKTVNITHGKSYSKIYKIYKTMLNRCYNINQKSFKYYGNRGIKVCDRWKNSFTNFLQDMGNKPEGLSIERINNDGDYKPTNCKWATFNEQAHNRRNIKLSVKKADIIRKLHLKGVTSKLLSKKFNVDISSIRLVINMKTWI